MLAQKDIQDSVRLMDELCIPATHKYYFLQTMDDYDNADMISLVDNLSSKAWWLCASQGSEEMRKHMVAHLEARKELIEKIKELRR